MRVFFVPKGLSSGEKKCKSPKRSMGENRTPKSPQSDCSPSRGKPREGGPQPGRSHHKKGNSESCDVKGKTFSTSWSTGNTGRRKGPNKEKPQSVPRGMPPIVKHELGGEREGEARAGLVTTSKEKKGVANFWGGGGKDPSKTASLQGGKGEPGLRSAFNASTPEKRVAHGQSATWGGGGPYYGSRGFQNEALLVGSWPDKAPEEDRRHLTGTFTLRKDPAGNGASRKAGRSGLTVGNRPEYGRENLSPLDLHWGKGRKKGSRRREATMSPEKDPYAPRTDAKKREASTGERQK